MQNPELQTSLQLIIAERLPVHMLEHLKPENAAPISHRKGHALLYGRHL
jgi:hypothetical protein